MPLYISSEEPTTEGIKRYVTFEQLKSRGPTAQEALYSYTVNDEGDYIKLFNSVQNECPDALEKTKQRERMKQAQAQDADLIEAIQSVLSAGECNQSSLVEQVRKLTTRSRNSVKACLQRWNLPENQGGLWHSRQGDNNATLYKLL